jgi:DNA replication protein DnaC
MKPTQKIADLFENLNLGSIENSDTTEKLSNAPIFNSTFKTSNNEDLNGQYASAVNFAQRIFIGQNPNCLTLSGNAGCGKTHLAHEVFKYVETHCRGYYVEPVGIKSIYWENADSIVSDAVHNEDRFNSLLRCFFLVIDDIGSGKMTDFNQEKLYQILNARLGKWTMITTNAKLDFFRSVDPRISSRLVRNGSIFYRSNASDYNDR